MTATKLHFMATNISKFSSAFQIKFEEMLDCISNQDSQGADMAHKTLLRLNGAEIKDCNPALKCLLGFI